MPLQFNPLVFGVILVVTVGTIAYTLWNSGRQQEKPYGAHSNYDFNFNSAASSNLSTEDDDERPQKKMGARERHCTICLKSLKTGQLRMLPCAHIFHGYCIAKWFLNSQTCPLCRTPSASV